LGCSNFIVYEVQKRGVPASDQVRAVQNALPLWSLPKDFAFDGVFGAKTEEAVKTFQTAYGLASDGIVGRTTGTALGVWRTVERGIDASHYQTIDWSKFDANIRFCIFKATEGATYEDPTFHFNTQSALNKGLSVSAYHYTKFANSAFVEAENFIRSCQIYLPKLDRLFLDVEHTTSGLDAVSVSLWVEVFGRIVNAFAPNKFGVYTSSRVLRELDIQWSDINRLGVLWGSDRTGQPHVYPWSHWDYWQYSSEGIVSGVQGQVDLNLRVVPPEQASQIKTFANYL